MKLWCTELIAMDQTTGEMKAWIGDNIEAPTAELAQKWCDDHKGYLRVTGELIAEVDFKGKITDYENIQNN